MINGTFDVSIDTPKHHKRGTLVLASSGDAISGKLEISEEDPVEFDGSCADKEFSFEGSGDFPGLGKISYNGKGSVWGSALDIDIESSAGAIKIFGTQLSLSTGGYKSSHEYMMKASTGEFDPNDNTMYAGAFSDGA